MSIRPTHTHPFNGPFSGTTQVGRYQKGNTNLDLLKQETVSGSGISWAICKSAPRSRQITTPAPHYSVFLQAGCPSCRPTNSVKALKAKTQWIVNYLSFPYLHAVEHTRNAVCLHRPKLDISFNCYVFYS